MRRSASASPRRAPRTRRRKSGPETERRRCGKGDGNIRYFECTPDKPWAFALSEHRSRTASKGVCFLPKRGLDVMKCETAKRGAAWKAYQETAHFDIDSSASVERQPPAFPFVHL